VIWMLPVVAGAVVISVVIFCYVYIVNVDQVPEWLNSISWATDYVWAANVFTLGFTIFSTLMTIIFVVWYDFFEVWLNDQRNPFTDKKKKHLHGLNVTAAVVSGVGTLGGFVLAAFPLKTPTTIAHDIGAITSFALMCLYAWLHCYLCRQIGYKRLLYTRFGMTIFGTIMFILFCVFRIVLGADGQYPSSWSSSFAEYVFAITMTFYYMSFAFDFWKMVVEVDVVRNVELQAEAAKRELHTLLSRKDFCWV